LILVNDGSTDNSLNVCRDFEANHSNVTLINIVNSGPANARNVGLKKAKSEYIGFVDADDYIDKNMYKTLYTAATKGTCKRLDIVMCAFYEVSNTATGLVKKTVQAELPANVILNNKEVITNVISKYYNGGMNGIGSLWNKIYRREFLVKNQLLIDSKLVRAEDHWFNFECFKKCQRFVYTNESMYFYVKDTENSVMKTYRSNQFDLFVSDRKKLRSYYEFDFDVNPSLNDRSFFRDSIEFMYLVIKNEQTISSKMKQIKKIIQNKDLNHCAKNIIGLSLHYTVLRFFLLSKSTILCIFILSFFSLIIKSKYD